MSAINSGHPRPGVIVVGAGPVGLLTALRLATAEPRVRVTLLEASNTIDASPRAMFYQPVAVRELDRAGVLSKIRESGMAVSAVCWRKPRLQTDGLIAEVDKSFTKECSHEDLIIGQNKIAAIILDKLRSCPGVDVQFDTKVIAVEQTNDKSVRVDAVKQSGEKMMFEAGWLVAADGAKSSLRKMCGIAFEGFTWEKQVVSANVYYPFDKYGWKDANFLIDREHWGLVAKINDQGLWRVSYGEALGLSDQDIVDRLPMKFDALFPGPRPLQFELVQQSPYRLNNRCAAKFRHGRVLLAGDAAHICSPFGGLGLTSGLLDGAALADALIAAINDGVSEDILDMYATKRRDVFRQMVDPISQANLRRLCEVDPDTVGDTDKFLKMLRNLDDERKKSLRGMDKIWVDIRAAWESGNNCGTDVNITDSEVVNQPAE